jgi:hypothetical protein
MFLDLFGLLFVDSGKIASRRAYRPQQLVELRVERLGVTVLSTLDKSVISQTASVVMPAQPSVSRAKTNQRMP